MPSQRSQPKLSICIPAHNRPLWIRRTLLSLLEAKTEQQNQVEIIISDDSTTFDVKKVVYNLIHEWKGKWSYYYNSPSLGMAANWNHCIQLARGSYVLLLHDDDYLERDAINTIISAVDKYEQAPVLLFGVNVVNQKEKIIKKQATRTTRILSQKEALRLVLTDSSFIRFPGIVFKKSIFQEIGYFNEAVGGIADIDLWVRIFKKYGLIHMRGVTANYTVHSDSLTTKMFTEKTLHDVEKIFKSIRLQDGLSKIETQKCKANFFHQFILAGTVRQIKSRDWKNARRVLNLLGDFDINTELTLIKWATMRVVLRLVLFYMPKLSSLSFSKSVK